MTRPVRAWVRRGRRVAAWVRVAAVLGCGALGAGLLVPLAAAPAAAAVLTGTAGLVSGVSRQLVSVSSAAGAVPGAVLREQSSPAAAAVSGGTEVLFSDQDGWLWQVDPGGGMRKAGDGMLPVLFATSPSVAQQGGQAWAAAFQCANQDMWTVDSAGREHDSGVMMMWRASPVIASVDGGYEVAFEGSDGYLWTYSSSGQAASTFLGVAPGTTPAIAALPGGGWEIAFHASGDSDHLWIRDSTGHATNTGLVMAPGSSPSINGNDQVAYTGADGYLRVRDTDGTVRTPGTTLGIAPGTSPVITATSGGGWQAAYQAAVEGTMWTVSSNPLVGTIDTGVAMTAGTSPALSGFINDSRWCQAISCAGGTIGGSVGIIRPAYDPVHCQHHLIDCQVADLNGDGAPDALGIVDHDSAANQGWQGGIIVALGNPGSTAADGSDLFSPPALWGGTGCDTPGDTCAYSPGTHSLVQFVTSPVTSPELTGATQGSVVSYPTGGSRFGPWATWTTHSPCQPGYFCGVGPLSTTTPVPALIAVNPADGTATVSETISTSPVIFSLPAPYGTTGCTAGMSCTVTDVNDDGLADITATNPATGDVAVSLATPSTIRPPAGWAAGACPRPTVCAFIDVNNDGLPDLVARNPGDTTLTPSQAWVSTSTGSYFATPALTDIQTALIPPASQAITSHEQRQLTPAECDAVKSGIKADMAAANYFGDLATPVGPIDPATSQAWANLFLIMARAAIALNGSYIDGSCPEDPNIFT